MTPVDQPPRSAEYEAGFDEETPYEDEDLTQYPDWWQANIQEFRSHGMRPYRPPQFCDDALVPEIITRLESELTADINIRAVDPRVGDDWQLFVNGQPIAEIARERVGGGYTEFKLSSAEFERLVREQLKE